MSKYPKTLGRIEAVWNKLGGEEGVDRFLRGELVVESRSPGFPIWKTIELGTRLKTAEDFRVALNACGNSIARCADDILSAPAFMVSETEGYVDLVNVSVADLGFKCAVSYWDIIEVALSMGLKLCPAEVGPQLWLQYPEQPKGEWLRIGMLPITSADDFHGIFGVTHHIDKTLGGGTYIKGRRVLTGEPPTIPKYFQKFQKDARFVFVRRKW